MSETKQPGWMSSCFQGRPRYALLFPFPEMPEAEKEPLRRALERMRGPNREEELSGMSAPEAHGGLGLSATACLKAMEEYGRLSGRLPPETLAAGDLGRVGAGLGLARRAMGSLGSRVSLAGKERDLFALESMAFAAARFADRGDLDCRIESAICGAGEIPPGFVALAGLDAVGAPAGLLGRARRALLPPPVPGVPACLEAEAAMIADGASVLRACCDRTLRKGLGKDEMALKRISDVATDLFGISATVSRTASRTAAGELALTRRFCREAFSRILLNEAELGSDSDREFLDLASPARADG